MKNECGRHIMNLISNLKFKTGHTLAIIMLLNLLSGLSCYGSSDLSTDFFHNIGSNTGQLGKSYPVDDMRTSRFGQAQLRVHKDVISETLLSSFELKWPDNDPLLCVRLRSQFENLYRVNRELHEIYLKESNPETPLLHREILEIDALLKERDRYLEDLSQPAAQTEIIWDISELSESMRSLLLNDANPRNYSFATYVHHWDIEYQRDFPPVMELLISPIHMQMKLVLKANIGQLCLNFKKLDVDIQF